MIHGKWLIKCKPNKSKYLDPDLSQVGNGVCNPDLDILECNYDGMDCPTTSTSTTTTTTRTSCPDWTKV